MAPRTFLEGVLAGLTGRQGISDQSWSSGGPERSGGGAQRLDLAGGAGTIRGGVEMMAEVLSAIYRPKPNEIVAVGAAVPSPTPHFQPV